MSNTTTGLSNTHMREHESGNPVLDKAVSPVTPVTPQKEAHTCACARAHAQDKDPKKRCYWCYWCYCPVQDGINEAKTVTPHPKNGVTPGVTPPESQVNQT